MSLHFRYKPKWRRLGGCSFAHCFIRTEWYGQYESLCGLRWPFKLIGGAECLRPPVQKRCDRCDIEEIRLLQVDESCPETKHWESQWEKR